MTATSNYLPYLHSFRGFAILTIVGAHIWSFLIFWSGTPDTTGLKTLFYATETLFHGSTLYFSILSGVLFQKVLIQKSWAQFYRSKLTNVLLPYAVLTLLLGTFYGALAPDSALLDSVSNVLERFIQNLWSGKGDIHFWYMPVLAILFVLTPLLSVITSRMPWLALILALVPLVVSRSTFPNFFTIQAVVYFIGAYTSGLLLGQYWDEFLAAAQRFRVWLMGIAAISSIWLFLLYWWDYQAGAWSLRQTLVYIQKVAIFALVVYLFRSLDTLVPKVFNILGTYAFAIYFTHVFFVGNLIMWWMPVLQQYRNGVLFFGIGLVNYVVGVACCVFFAMGLKKLLGRYSRWVCGA